MTAIPDALAALCDELRKLQRERTIVLKSRIMLGNRLQAVIAGTLGYKPSLTEKERTKLFIEAAKLITAVEKGEADHPLKKVIETTRVGIGAFEEHNKDLELRMRRLARQLPVVAWIKKPEQNGFDFLSLAKIVGECGDLTARPDNFPCPDRLWRRMGCTPILFDGQKKMGSTWRKGKEGKLPSEVWAEAGYSPRRRSIMYVIGECLVKSNFLNGPGGGEDDETGMTDETSAPRRPGPYRKRYDDAKAAAHEAHPDWSKLRCHRHGMLLASKKILKELWRVWNRRPADAEYEAGQPWLARQKA